MYIWMLLLLSNDRNKAIVYRHYFYTLFYNSPLEIPDRIRKLTKWTQTQIGYHT